VKRAFKLIVVGAVLWLELLYFVMHNPYPHGDIVDVFYRQKSRLAAHGAYMREPSTVTKAAFDSELRRMRAYERIRMVVSLGLVVAANGVGVYYFLGYGTRKTKA
jgi:hypothetical protein